MRFVSVLFLHFRRIPGESRAEQQPQRRISARVGCPAAAAELHPRFRHGASGLCPTVSCFGPWPRVFVLGLCPVRLFLGSAQNSPGSVQSGSLSVRSTGSVRFVWFGPE